MSGHRWVIPHLTAALSASYLPQVTSTRNLGLDVVRSLAIFLVVACHALPFFARYVDVVSPFLFLGFLGVEMFFVLSGFLIGGIVIEDLVEGGAWVSLVRFYLRRWLRTLPAYFVALAVLILAGRPFYWQNLVFLQNFDARALDAFPVSWSLSVEEWFYLLLPIVLLVAVKQWQRWRVGVFFGTCVGIVVLSLAARIYWTHHFDPSWDYGIRKQVFLRMDSLMIGVLLAGTRAYFPTAYATLTRSPRILGLLSLAGLVCLVAYWTHLSAGGGVSVIRHLDQSIFARTLFFDLVSADAAVLVAALEASRPRQESAGQGRLTRLVQGLSRASYSLYLVHASVLLYFLGRRSASAGLWECLGWLAIGLAATWALTYCLYRWVEVPGMAMRERIGLAASRRRGTMEHPPESLPAAGG